jgi:hypothetical protein
MQLLKRRKMTLKKFLNEQGITTYISLVNRCNELGVLEPTNEEYNGVAGELVTSQCDGVIVLEPIPIINESTGKSDNDVIEVSDDELSLKKRKRKKNVISNEENVTLEKLEN